MMLEPVKDVAWRSCLKQPTYATRNNAIQYWRIFGPLVAKLNLLIKYPLVEDFLKTSRSLCLDARWNIFIMNPSVPVVYTLIVLSAKCEKDFPSAKRLEDNLLQRTANHGDIMFLVGPLHLPGNWIECLCIYPRWECRQYIGRMQVEWMHIANIVLVKMYHTLEHWKLCMSAKYALFCVSYTHLCL